MFWSSGHREVFGFEVSGFQDTVKIVADGGGVDGASVWV